MNTVPQISRRKIGSVTIIDLHGELIGPWALKAKDNIHSLVENSRCENLLINLKDLKTVDSLGVKAIIENFPSNTKNGLICGRISIMEMFSDVCFENDLKIFSSEKEVIDYFGEDFVKDNELSHLTDQRRSVRLKTAVPLEFWYLDKENNKITFNAIVTDLSETGLFAEYLDVQSFEDFDKYLNPRELKELHMKMKLPDYDPIFFEGMVVRTVFTGEQVGLGVRVTHIEASEKNVIKDFLEI